MPRVVSQYVSDQAILGRQGAVLFLGRLTAFVFSFAVPLIVVRILDREEFGLYRQLWLVHQTVLDTLPFGLPASVMYFNARDPRESAAYTSQTFLSLVLLAVLAGGALTLWRHDVATGLNNPALAAHLPWMALVVACSMLAAAFEQVMLAAKRSATAATSTAIFETLRAACITAAITRFATVRAAMMGASVWALARVIAVATLLGRGGFLPWTPPTLDRLRAQFAYCVPFGMAAVLVGFIESVHFYWVSRRFGVSDFALYSVGFLQVPVIFIFLHSITDVTLVRITQLRAADALEEAAQVIRQATLRVCAVLFPMFVCLVLLAREIMVLLYTERFAASASIFKISVIMIPLAAMGLDYVPRAFADTGFILRVNLLRGACVVTFIALGTPFGLEGIALGTVMAAMVSKSVILWRVARLLGVGIQRTLPWRAIGVLSGASAAAGAVAWLSVTILALEGGGRALALTAVFAIAYAGALAVTGFIRWHGGPARSLWSLIALDRGVTHEN